MLKTNLFRKIAVPLSSIHPTKKYFLSMFAISCVLLEIFSFVIYEKSRIAKHSNDWVIHSYQILRTGRQTLIDAIDLSNQAISYISGTSSNLTPYNTLSDDIDRHLEDLQRQAMDNPDQVANIEYLKNKIGAFKRLLGTYISDRRSRDIDARTVQIRRITVENAIANLRGSFDTFSVNEDELLSRRTQKAEVERQNYLWTLGIGDLLGLCALILANWLIFSLMAKNSRAEENLRKSQSNFSMILSGISEGVFDQDFVKNTIDYSQSYQSILGYDKKELGSTPDIFQSLIHPEDAPSFLEALKQYIDREASTYFSSFRMRHKEGHWVWVLARGVGTWNESGQIQRMVGTHTDISLQKQREEELRYFMLENEQQHIELGLAKEAAEAASQAKSDFLTTMSHEIRTPMNAVIGLTRLMLDTKLDDKQEEMIKTLYANAGILLQLVNDLLDISRIEEQQIKLEARPFSFDTLLESLQNVFATQAQAKGLTLSVVNNVGSRSFLGDSIRIQQILINLISNALKFTSEGSITVAVNSKPLDETTEQIDISVSDTGVGIPAEKIDRIFEKFVQADQTISRRFGGSGLGLAICKSLVELMNGTITVGSSAGHGSVFTFSIPLQTNKAKLAPIVAPATAPIVKTAASSGMVLIVEDYASNVLVAEMMLESLGYESDVAKNGFEAIEKVQQRSTPYRAILMDVQMHDMDGYATTQRIRAIEAEKGFRHSIIGVTAHALATDREKCLAAGMDDYMSKPIHYDLLAQKLGALSKVA